MRPLARDLITTTAALCVVAAGGASAHADSPSPVKCSNPSSTGLCVVTVNAPGHGGGSSGGNAGVPDCVFLGDPVPCSRPGLGYWDGALDCYLTLTNPQPPTSDPLWHGHTTGAIYTCTTWPPVTTGAAEIWLPTAPAADPQTLAARAVKLLRLPQPSGARSPSQSQRYDGYPFSYVNLWTWFWTASAQWRSYTATASAGGVSATVTVRPVALLFDPGDGSPVVSCAGPGRAWTDADGDGTPTGGGCGYRYTTATSTPITSTQSIRWAVTWRASDGETGTLPDLTTSRSGQLMVLQVESVATR